MQNRTALGSTFLILAVSLLISMLLPVYAHSGISLSAFTPVPPAIDGIMAFGEWDNADSIDVTLDYPGGGTTPGTIFVMNDATSLYLAFRFEQATVTLAGDVADFRFDNDHSGGTFWEMGEDYVGCFAPSNLRDQYVFQDDNVGSIDDETDGGSEDGTCAFGNDGTHSFYELSHPLNDADDAHDFSLNRGDTVGFLAGIGIGGLDGRTDSSSPPGFPFNDLDSWHDLVIARPAVPPTIVGGEILGVDSMSLFLASINLNGYWIVPTLLGIAGTILGLRKFLFGRQ